MTDEQTTAAASLVAGLRRARMRRGWSTEPAGSVLTVAPASWLAFVVALPR
ncbi:hypothetical protein [Micromonospora rubida]|uniref:hypothetical protein n=1 Tax=Micromonospora rubida TaxID=2697657 RepID=UPI00191BD8B2|nr:hypothetical protein [Micromonospora rubida]